MTAEYPSPSRLTPCLLAAIMLLAGCASQSKWYSPQQLDQGYTILLPGILGCGPWDQSLAKNLNAAGDPAAVEICDWTKGPVLFLYNALHQDRKQAQARQIAQHIVEYQAHYPGRPVHLVGHSGGASMVAMVLEALPAGQRVQSAAFLGAGLPSDYDLSSALAHTESGIHNYYSYLDVPISMVFSGLLTVVRGHPQRTAGAFGFQPSDAYEAAETALGVPPLVQHRYGFDMLKTGHLGGHFGWTWGPFVRQELAPMLAQTPADASDTSAVQPVTFVVTDQSASRVIVP